MGAARARPFAWPRPHRSRNPSARFATPPNQHKTVGVVPIQETIGYGVGFGVPTAAFVVAILLFLAGWRLYTILPPQGSPFTRMWRVLSGAWRNRALPLPADPDELYDGDGDGDDGKDEAAAPLVAADDATPTSGRRKFGGCGGAKKPRRLNELTERMPHTEGMAFLDKAAIQPPPSSSLPLADAAPGAARAARPVTVSTVEESKAFYRIMPIFALVVIYQMTYDPIFTLLPYPGDAMDRRIGGSGALIPASSISFANTFGGEFVGRAVIAWVF